MEKKVNYKEQRKFGNVTSGDFNYIALSRGRYKVIALDRRLLEAVSSNLLQTSTHIKYCAINIINHLSCFFSSNVVCLTKLFLVIFTQAGDSRGVMPLPPVFVCFSAYYLKNR